MRAGGRAAGDVALAVSYLHEVDEAVTPSEAAIDLLNVALREAVEVEDPTADVDPRITLALSELRAGAEALEHVGELRMRLAGCALFTALLEAGFSPENNWEEAVDSQEASQDLAHVATNGNRPLLVANTYGSGRVMAFAEANGVLYAAAGLEQATPSSPVEGGLYRRVDGPKLTFISR